MRTVSRRLVPVPECPECGAAFYKAPLANHVCDPERRMDFEAHKRGVPPAIRDGWKSLCGHWAPKGVNVEEFDCPPSLESYCEAYNRAQAGGFTSPADVTASLRAGRWPS